MSSTLTSGTTVGILTNTDDGVSKHEGSDEGGERAFERLAQTGTLTSTAVVKAPDGQEWPIEYRIDVEGDAYRMLVRRREG